MQLCLCKEKRPCCGLENTQEGCETPQLLPATSALKWATYCCALSFTATAMLATCVQHRHSTIRVVVSEHASSPHAKHNPASCQLHLWQQAGAGSLLLCPHSCCRLAQAIQTSNRCGVPLPTQATANRGRVQGHVKLPFVSECTAAASRH